MSRYTLDELERQTLALPDDLPGLIKQASEQVLSALYGRPSPDRVVVLGSGDSLNAAIACAPAFGGVEYRPMSAAEYTAQPAVPRGRTVVVAVSASGNNPLLVDAVAGARSGGCHTIAVTANPRSPLGQATETIVELSPGPLEPSPGIRTYQSSLVALLQLAGSGVAADPLVEAVGRSIALGRPHVSELVDAFADAPVVMVVGSGAGLGTARHIAAKVTECAAVPAVGAELEDWWHVHRFGHDPLSPVLFIGTPGPARETVLTIMRRTVGRRPVVVIAAEDDQEAASLGALVVPVAADIPHIHRPLADHVVAGLLAAGLARRRGILPFANP